MDEQDKKFIENIKSSEIPEEQKKHMITCIRKDRRQREALMRLPKEQRLKRICRNHVILAFEEGKRIQDALNTPEHKETAEYFERRFRRQCGSGLTWSLKEAKVLPLGK